MPTVGSDDFAAGGAGDCFLELGRVGIAVGEVDEDDAARLGEVVGLKRLAAGVEAHVAPDYAVALCFADDAGGEVALENFLTVVAFDEPRVDVIE